jgi:lipid A 3-O-deacylase
MAVRVKNVHLKLICLMLIIFLFHDLHAQRIKNESVVRNLSSDHYFRFYYENDFVTLIDYYYTSGMNVELVKPSLQKNPLNKIFFGVPGAEMKYGFALDHYAFTPLHIVEDEISYGDRPYAGCISANSFRIATDEKKRRRISTSLILGMIGPVAGWKQAQTFLHKHVVAAPQPKGWHYQIVNDIILNYNVNLEKNLISKGSFMLNTNAEAIVGTMNDKLDAGLSLMIGRMNDPYKSSSATGKKWEFYVFGRSFVSGVAYDATLQGGMFNKTSPYTLPASKIKKITLQNQIGAILRYKKISVELSESFLSPEFEGGRSHIWGGLGIAVELK